LKNSTEILPRWGKIIIRMRQFSKPGMPYLKNSRLKNGFAFGLNRILSPSTTFSSDQKNGLNASGFLDNPHS